MIKRHIIFMYLFVLWLFLLINWIDVTYDPALVWTKLIPLSSCVLSNISDEFWWDEISLPICTGYSPKHYQRGLYILIYKVPNNCRPHTLRNIILFDIVSNMHNKYICRITMGKTENLDRLALEKYGSWKSKVADIQYLNTRLFYYLIRQKRTPEIRICADLVSKYDL